MSSRREQAGAIQDWMVEQRRHLHRQPEIGLELPDTHDLVESVLRELGLALERHHGAGLTVTIAGSDPDGTTVVLRADMDALPVTERSGVAFASTRAGAMHACGHDLHTAMLLGAARVLAEAPPLNDVVLAFQPGEESDHGALKTLQQHRNLQLGPATAAFAIHVHSTLPPHTVQFTRDVFMAYGDWFRVDLHGPGGHAARPEDVGNPIEAAARFVLMVRELAETLTGPERLVATVTEVVMGNSVNVIPATGRLRGTIRTLSAARRDLLIEGLRAVAEDAAQEVGVTAEFDLTEGYPAVRNDPAYVERMVTRLGEVLGSGAVIEMTEPSMVIEDFSYFLGRWPGAMVYLGANVPGHDSFNHSDDVVFDESVMSTGTTMLLEAADGFRPGLRSTP